ncbi:EI24 domain-containing protein [Vannielia sp.]|uniref:EI24 domain-containing protein n=1 Tax=Vannielia sp. TaxID=2813045 RepID=UPI002603764A|nr:EI24 domain-containing protein [Vannielia sp.]MDF1872170.1 EI24 domain-containing protein [Vannielia sp.]
MLDDISKAIGQMLDRRFIRVLAMGLGLTVALLVGVYIVFAVLIGWVVPDDFSLFGWQMTWLDNALTWAAIPLVLVMSIFLMVPVASAFTGLFLDDVAQAVEDRHYPALPDVPRTSFLEGITDALGFFGVLVLVNILLLIVYFFSGPLAPLVFWAANGFLLGREYYQMVAMRHLGRQGANASRKKNMMAIWGAGTLMAIPLTVPVMNLFIPILGVATFTHLFHRKEPQLRASHGGVS